MHVFYGFLIYLLLVIFFFRIAPSLILLRSCPVTKNTSLATHSVPNRRTQCRIQTSTRGHGHSDPYIRGGGGGGWGRSPKQFFSALRALVWYKNRWGGGEGGAGSSPRSATGTLACIAFGKGEAHGQNRLLVYLKRMVIYLVNF